MAWVLGTIALAIALAESLSAWLGLLWGGALLLFGGGCFTWNRRPAHPLAVALMLPLAGVAVVTWTHWRTPVPEAWEREGDVSRATVTGRVLSDPQAGVAGYRYVCGVTSLNGQAVSGNLLAVSRRAPEKGQRVLLEGRLFQPRATRNPGDFDYRLYLARRGVFLQLAVQRFQVLEGAPYDPIGQLRDRWQGVFLQVLPPERANLAASLVYGARSARVDPEIETNFRTLGLSHMLAASGYQVGLILWVAAFLRTRWAIGLTAMLLGVYVALTGAPPSILRAAAVGGLSLVALSLKRGIHPMRAFGVGMAVLLICDPLMLWDVGFQLSVAATFALLHTVPLVRPGWLQVVALPVVVQLWVMPVQLYHFGAVPWLAIPANWAGSVGVSGVTLLGFASGLVGLIWEPLAIAPLLLLDLLLQGALAVVAWSAAWPGIVSHVPPFSVAWLALCYAWVWGVVNRQPVLGWGAAAALVWIPLWVPRPLEVTFLAAGQGDAIHIRTPSGRHLLMDGGPPGDQTLRYLERQGVWELDAVLLSHPQADHLGGLLPLVGKLELRSVWDGGFDYPSQTYQRWLSGLLQRGVPIQVARRGLSWHPEPGVSLRVLAPDSGMGDFAANDQSLVVWLRHGEVDLLLTGDVEQAAEDRLVAAGLPDVDVLKVAHHGSRSSSSPDFLAAVKPEAAIIQVAQRSRFGHPHPEALLRLSQTGARLFRSDRGAVRLVSDGRHYAIFGPE